VLFVSYLLLGLALVAGNGDPAALALVLASAALLFVGLRRPARFARTTPAIAVAASAVLSLTHDPTDGGALRVVLWSLGGLLGAVALLCFWRPRLAGRASLGVVLGIYAAAGVTVIELKPPPRIDVLEIQQGGARALEAGLDPYTVTFRNPYTPDETRRFFGDGRTELREYPYPPLSLVATAVGYVVGHDVRWTLLAAQIGIGIVLFAIARGAGHDPSVALAIVALHLLELRGLHMLDQGWTDSMPALAFLAVALLLQRRARGLGMALGLFVALKQYSVVALPILARDGRIPRRAWMIALALATAVTLPFLLWGPRDFVADVVLFQLRQPFRMDALSIPAYVARATGWQAPGVFALAGGGAAIAMTWSRLGPRSVPGALPLATAFAYAGFFLFAKQAFCNYYYFVGVVILGAAALLEPRTSDL